MVIKYKNKMLSADETYSKEDHDILEKVLGKTKETEQSDISDHYYNLKTYFQNEVFAPEILDYQQASVDTLLTILRKQQEYIESLCNDNSESPNMCNISVPIYYEMELERVRYIVKRYLRTRLEKIERYHAFIIKSEEQLQRLSDEEYEYLTKYNEIVEEYEEEAFLHRIPEANPKEKHYQNVEPYLFVPVTVKSNATSDPIQLLFKGSKDPVQIDPGEKTIVPYEHIKELVYSKALSLH
jgi:GINS complex subunit 4